MELKNDDAFYVNPLFSPLSLYEMMLGAEKIVYGEITRLDSETFTFKIERSLIGKESELIIQRFQNWPCAHRWTDYKIGQRLFLFLRTYEGMLYSMSGGNEGELPIENDSVYINGLSLDPPPPPRPDGTLSEYSNTDFIDLQKHEVKGMSYFGHKTDLISFIETVLQIRNCFEIEYGKYKSIQKATILCDENELQKNIESNKILNWVYRKLKNKT